MASRPAPAEPPGTGPRGGIQVLHRATAVLRAVAGGAARLGELADTLALPKTTVHRIVGTLADDGLLRTDAAGRIWLGPAVAGLAAAAEGGLVARLRPVLVELARELDETVDLSVPDGGGVRFVDQVQGTQRLRAVSAVGALFPLHCTANGKAVLAALPTETAHRLLPARLPRLTRHTITERARLLEQLDAVRREGVALDLEEHTEGIAAVGAALTSLGGPVAAISVPVPIERFEGQRARIVEHLVAAVRSAEELA